MLVMTDDQLLATLPDHVRFDTLMKARPAQEGDERIIYTLRGHNLRFLS